MSKHTKRLHEVTTVETPEIRTVEDVEIQKLAYELWLERGCPIGSPEDDWYRAEEQLRGRTEVAGVAA